MIILLKLTYQLLSKVKCSIWSFSEREVKSKVAVCATSIIQEYIGHIMMFLLLHGRCDSWWLRAGLKSVLKPHWLQQMIPGKHHPRHIGPKIPCMWTNSWDPLWPLWPSHPSSPASVPPIAPSPISPLSPHCSNPHEQEQKVTFSSKALLAISHC